MKHNSYQPQCIHLFFCTVGDILFEGIFDSGFYNLESLTFKSHVHSQHEIHVVSEGEYTLESPEATTASFPFCRRVMVGHAKNW